MQRIIVKIENTTMEVSDIRVAIELIEMLFYNCKHVSNIYPKDESGVTNWSASPNRVLSNPKVELYVEDGDS